MYPLTRAAYWNYYIKKITQKMLLCHEDIVFEPGCFPRQNAGWRRAFARACSECLTDPPTELSGTPSVSCTQFSVDASLGLCQRDQGNSVIKIKLRHVLSRPCYNLIERSRTHDEMCKAKCRRRLFCKAILLPPKFTGNKIKLLCLCNGLRFRFIHRLKAHTIFGVFVCSFRHLKTLR